MPADDAEVAGKPPPAEERTREFAKPEPGPPPAPARPARPTRLEHADEPTEVLPPEPATRYSLAQQMRAEPGFLARLVAEWAVVALTVAGVCSVVFLLVLGAHALVVVAP